MRKMRVQFQTDSAQKTCRFFPPKSIRLAHDVGAINVIYSVTNLSPLTKISTFNISDNPVRSPAFSWGIPWSFAGRSFDYGTRRSCWPWPHFRSIVAAIEHNFNSSLNHNIIPRNYLAMIQINLPRWYSRKYSTSCSSISTLWFYCTVEVQNAVILCKWSNQRSPMKLTSDPWAPALLFDPLAVHTQLKYKINTPTIICHFWGSPILCRPYPWIHR